MGVFITLTGYPGSGKSTIGKLLAQKLNTQYYGMGEIRRQYALQQGITLEELNSQAEQDSTSDFLVDEFQKELPKKYSSAVVDGRTSFHFIPQSVKIFFTVDEQVAVHRIFSLRRQSEHWKSVDDGIHAIHRREQSDKVRYQNLYNINPWDLTQFDLVLDTTHTNAEEIVDRIIDFLKQKNLFDVHESKTL